MAKRWGSVSLRTKITGVTVFILTLGLVVAGAGTLSFLRPQLIAQQDTILTQLRADPTPALASGANTAGLIRGDVLYAPEGYYVAMLDGQGELVYDNFRAKPEGSAPAVNVAAVDVVSGNIFSLQSPNGEEWHAVATPVTSTTAGPQPSGILLIAQSTSLVNSFMVRYITIFSGFGFAVILLGAALTRILVTSTFEPLAEVERTAAEIAKGDFSKRIQVPDEGTEVGHLGRSLNTMLDRIDDAFDDRAQTIEQMRRFIGDASHELRTPLVSVRGYAELYRMGALQEPEQIGQAMERIEKEAIRMGSLVEDLLALARLDERRTMQMQPLNLIPLARDAAMDTMAQAPDRLVRVIVDPSALTASGDALPPAFAPALASGPAEPAAQDAPAPDAGPREPAVPEPGEATAASEARTPGRGLNLRGVGKLGSNGTRSWT
ncbi:sensor histidine kinase, partial [Leucobacter sp. M11]|uniref:sensor histidine kinase n=1 Tax=Leucobacter sp. M11 TaxID=2993565 RepID=UPI002D7F998C